MVYVSILLKQKTKTNHPPECIGHSLFFWDHTTLEEDVSGTNSKYNREEINKITEVAKYLVRNDYPPKDITVLCAYRVQAS